MVNTRSNSISYFDTNLVLNEKSQLAAYVKYFKLELKTNIKCSKSYFKTKNCSTCEFV